MISLLLLSSCRKDNIALSIGSVTPYAVEYPNNFKLVPKIKIPADNPMTVQGVELGRNLFYETLLSGDNTQACATCHMPETGFNDPLQFSVGIDGLEGKRHSMPLFNLGWMDSLFWDGRSNSLEAQALIPVTDVVEMHNTWPAAVAALQATDRYPSLFKAAFGTDSITSDITAKALAQFERTLISGNSVFDKQLEAQWAIGAGGLTGSDYFLFIEGRDIFEGERGDCAHCHGGVSNPLFTDNEFRNNGLDALVDQDDPGLAGVTGDQADYAKFKTPSVRNLLFTAPYMHDGRFNTIDEVIDHYSVGLKDSPTIDPFMKNVDQGGVNLTPSERSALKFFLECLTDSSFVKNPAFQDPELD
ncbi:MAG: cytochrome-c peroxidase [Crocinitomicaceae bacterium]